MELKPDQLVLCTVDRIVGTTVFVRIEGNGEGSIVMSEIAPGRIRNIRDYVVPNKKIVCKILDIENEHINLSLRRVAAKEKKEVIEAYEKERDAETTLKIVSKEKTKEIINHIKPQKLSEFLNQARENPSILEKFMNREEIEKLIKILKDKKERQIEIKRNFSVKCNEPNAISLIKKVLSNQDKDTKIIYLAASKFSMIIKSNDFKEANNKANNLLIEITRKCKENSCQIETEK